MEWFTNIVKRSVKKLRIYAYHKFRKFQAWKYRTVYGMDIGKNTGINRKAKLDTNVYPQGIHIGNNVNILAEAIVLSHDACRNLKADTYIGDNVIIGIRSIILPGISIGNNCVTKVSHLQIACP